VGFYYGDEGGNTAIPFVHDPQSANAGDLNNLTTLSAPTTYNMPGGINNNGIIAGEDQDPSMQSGYVWDPVTRT
jgi:hypothetical protein